jgi:hypothetical protein
MITASKKYGNILQDSKALSDFQKKNMAIVDFSKFRKINKILPDKIYCNKIIVNDLFKVFEELRKEKLITEIKSYDGCFNPRYIRGMEAKKILSNHAYGTALDFNAIDNPLGKTRLQNIENKLHPWSADFISVWEKYNFINGYRFSRGDGMHFEYINIV